MQSKGAKALLEYSFLKVFADNQIIDADELAFLQKIAMEDNQIDQEEKIVLSNIFSRVTREQSSEKVWADIQQWKQKYGVD